MQDPITLWDIMKLFKSREFILFLNDLQDSEKMYERCREEVISGDTPVQPLSTSELKDVLDFMETGKKLCDDAGLIQSEAKIGLTHTHIKNHPEKVDWSSLYSDYRNIGDVIMSEFWDRKFVQVPAGYSAHVNSQCLFGERVHIAFPSAREDIKESGNCLAVECSTAAVFHLMRVSEFGLRALARDRSVKIPKDVPLDLGTWEDIIRQLEFAENAIQGYPKTLAREAQYDFYHGAMMEFKRFKNKFRNAVMHTRDSYDPDQANSAFGHVKAFMEILSSVISESKKTPMIWKRDWSKP